MRNRGFTLIEVVVTLAIIAVLASIALPSTRLVVQRAKEKELREALWQIRDAIDRYKEKSDGGFIAPVAGGNGYPPTLEDLVKGVDNAKVPDSKLYFLRRIPRDPFCNCPSKAPEDTWGLRSYKSPPDSPQDGDDVFDVYSLSREKGLNGIPYKDW